MSDNRLKDNWKDAFQPHILLRGRNYYQDGLVSDLTVVGDDISAYVSGSEFYKVKIRKKNSCISSAYCSCPYFNGGEYCKHLAAVMYAVSEDVNAGEAPYSSNQSSPEQPSPKLFTLGQCMEDNLSSGQSPTGQAPAESLFSEQFPAGQLSSDTFSVQGGCSNSGASLADLINNAGREQLVDAVISLAARDTYNKSIIAKVLSCAPTIHSNKAAETDAPRADLTEMMAEAESIFRSYGGRHRFIDYYKAMDFTDELCDYLSYSSELLIGQGRYLDAFSLSKYVFLRLSRTDIDDDGNISEISGVCWRIWEKVAEKCSEEELQEMRQTISELCDGETVIDYMEDTLRDFLDQVLITPDEMRAEMAELDKVLCKPFDGEQGSYYSRRGQVYRRRFLMEKLGASEEESQEFWFSHDELEDVKSDLLDYLYENKKWDEEIQLLIRYRKKSSESYKDLSYTEKLINLYRLTGNKAMEKKELAHYINESGACSIEVFRAYKALFSASEWKTERDKIIENEKLPEKKCAFLFEEKLYDRLFEEVQKSGIIKLYDKYGFALEKKYAPQILAFYKGHVKKIAFSARNQARYNDMVAYLRRMQQFSGGKDIVSSLASNLAETYPTRKLMVKMLRDFF